MQQKVYIYIAFIRKSYISFHDRERTGRREFNHFTIKRSYQMLQFLPSTAQSAYFYHRQPRASALSHTSQKQTLLHNTSKVLPNRRHEAQLHGAPNTATASACLVPTEQHGIKNITALGRQPAQGAPYANTDRALKS